MNASSFSIVVVAEGAVPEAGTMAVPQYPLDENGYPRLGGIANVIAPEIEERTGFGTRVTILGHVQRGGTPVAFDRLLGTRFGIAAVELAAAGGWGRMVSRRGQDIVDVPLAEATVAPAGSCRRSCTGPPRSSSAEARLDRQAPPAAVGPASSLPLRLSVVGHRHEADEAMRAPWPTAEVGDDWYGDDPTVNRLQERAAELTGHEAALYVPTGTMANQIGIRLHVSGNGHLVACRRARARGHDRDDDVGRARRDRVPHRHEHPRRAT